jgi:hypothetical protein
MKATEDATEHVWVRMDQTTLPVVQQMKLPWSELSSEEAPLQSPLANKLYLRDPWSAQLVREWMCIGVTPVQSISILA